MTNLVASTLNPTLSFKRIGGFGGGETVERVGGNKGEGKSKRKICHGVHPPSRRVLSFLNLGILGNERNQRLYGIGCSDEAKTRGKKDIIFINSSFW